MSLKNWFPLIEVTVSSRERSFSIAGMKDSFKKDSFPLDEKKLSLAGSSKNK